MASATALVAGDVASATAVPLPSAPVVGSTVAGRGASTTTCAVPSSTADRGSAAVPPRGGDRQLRAATHVAGPEHLAVVVLAAAIRPLSPVDVPGPVPSPAAPTQVLVSAATTVVTAGGGTGRGLPVTEAWLVATGLAFMLLVVRRRALAAEPVPASAVQPHDSSPD